MRWLRRLSFTITVVLVVLQSRSEANQDSSCEVIQRGEASWYGPGFNGNTTSSGDIFNMHDFTAAHRNFPFDTRIRVTNQMNGRSVVVRVNDRGPYEGGRVLDLSKAAAQKIDLIEAGTGPVTIEVCDADAGVDAEWPDGSPEELLTSTPPYPRPDVSVELPPPRQQ